MLNQKELLRYNRHIILPEIGKAGQEKLKTGKVLVIGAGGLGSPVLQYLTAAGVGKIGIIDNDKVEESNLQRQVLFSEEDIGQPKAETAANKLRKQNPHITIKPYNVCLTPENAIEVIQGYDVVVDGSDNFPTRYLVNDACVILKKPLVFGAIFKFEGQVAVFNYQNGPTYRCLFPEPPEQGEVPNCSEIGVIGVLPGLIGTIQANEALKVLLGIGEVLSGKLMTLNTLTMETGVFRFDRNDKNLDVKMLEDYSFACSTDNSIAEAIKSITPKMLMNWLAENKEVRVIDVREPFEYETCRLENSQLIPLAEIGKKASVIPKDRNVVVICHHGQRSAYAIDLLQKKYGLKNLYNLEGGIHAWALDIDQNMPVY